MAQIHGKKKNISFDFTMTEQPSKGLNSLRYIKVPQVLPTYLVLCITMSTI